MIAKFHGRDYTLQQLREKSYITREGVSLLGISEAAEANKVHLDMEHDRAAGLWTETGMPELAWESCADLARRHCARLGVRTLDTLHVASALQLKAERFWTFDDRQSKLANAVGLKIT